MILVVLSQVQAVDVVDENSEANDTVTAAITAVALYGDFFSIIVNEI